MGPSGGADPGEKAPGARVKEVAPGRGWSGREGGKEAPLGTSRSSPALENQGDAYQPRCPEIWGVCNTPLSLVGMVFLRKRRGEEEKTRSGKGSVFQACGDE